MIGTGDGHRTVCWDIPRDPTVLGDVRGKVRRALGDWKFTDGGELTDDVVLATSEVLSNAVLYGLPPIQLTLCMSDHDVLAEVTDHGAGRPRRQVADDDAEHGRGLTIVEAVCDEWGVMPAPDGSAKTVWFRKSCSG
ncbi:ATP-binding protein [Sphaerisporangium fuscum]|uniref:ATP-binding protein n=1 Tax=Sphaerisporangium fuscum TaxID=2835868 RepID=UPI001BDDC097|nr:ATP-binding protein [Sphaerisporangium fuscum]